MPIIIIKKKIIFNKIKLKKIKIHKRKIFIYGKLKKKTQIKKYIPFTAFFSNYKYKDDSFGVETTKQVVICSVKLMFLSP